MYPLKFHPIYRQYSWGGERLRRYKDSAPEGVIAECWDVSCHPEGVSVVAHGAWAGKTLPEIIKHNPVGILGTFCSKRLQTIPLIAKLLDVQEQLVLQVHPGDKAAKLMENMNCGKSEMWYIMHADPGSQVACGLNHGLSKREVESAMENGTIEYYLNMVEVNEGDVLSIPAGMMHSCSPGVTMAVIQHGSDIAYSIYDFHRKSSEFNESQLQLDKAKKAMRTDIFEQPRKGLIIEERSNFSKSIMVACKNFVTERIILDGYTEYTGDHSRFHILTCVKGSCLITTGYETSALKSGETIFAPASINSYRIDGKCHILKTWIPDLGMDIIGPLINARYSIRSMWSHIAGLEMEMR